MTFRGQGFGDSNAESYKNKREGKMKNKHFLFLIILGSFILVTLLINIGISVDVFEKNSITYQECHSFENRITAIETANNEIKKQMDHVINGDGFGKTMTMLSYFDSDGTRVYYTANVSNVTDNRNRIDDLAKQLGYRWKTKTIKTEEKWVKE